MSRSQVVDLDQALAWVGGDKEFYRELLGMLLDGTPAQVQEMREALETGAAERLERVAHSLKGAAASLEAGLVRDTALRLEMLGREADLAAAPKVLAELEAELARLRQFAQGLE